MQESQVVIDVHYLTGDERREILYNHLKLGRQSAEFRAEIKPYLERIVDRDGFVPETARRISDPFFTKALRISEYSL